MVIRFLIEYWEIAVTELQLISVSMDFQAILMNGQFIQESELEIKTDDVPILTDQFSPVERLLNPVTSKTLIIREQSSDVLQSFFWSEHTYITIFLLFIVCIYWLLQMRQIWKKQVQISIA